MIGPEMSKSNLPSAQAPAHARWPVLIPGQRPILTVLIAGITAITTMLELISPQLLLTFERDPARFAAGDWWRLITPLFVRDGVWLQFFFLIGILLVGPAIEYHFGRI